MSSDHDSHPLAKPLPIEDIQKALEVARQKGVTHVIRNRVYNISLLKDGVYVGYVDLLFGELAMLDGG